MIVPCRRASNVLRVLCRVIFLDREVLGVEFPHRDGTSEYNRLVGSSYKCNVPNLRVSLCILFQALKRELEHTEVSRSAGPTLYIASGGPHGSHVVSACQNIRISRSLTLMVEK